MRKPMADTRRGSMVMAIITRLSFFELMLIYAYYLYCSNKSHLHVTGTNLQKYNRGSVDGYSRVHQKF